MRGRKTQWDRDECCRQYRYNSGRHLDREAVAGWRLTEYDSAQHGIWVAEYWWIDTLPVWAMRFPGPEGRPGNSPVRKGGVASHHQPVRPVRAGTKRPSSNPQIPLVMLDPALFQQ